MHRPLVVNLFGSPGTGKSTGSAYIFSKLKMDWLNAELITEFAKDKTWEHNKAALSDQFYIFGNQNFRMSRVADQVDIILTDSPLLLSMYYAGNDPLMTNFKKACLDVFNTYDNLNFLLKRVKKYNPIGRNQTEAESDKAAFEIENLLKINNIKYLAFPGCQEGYEQIYRVILDELKKRKGDYNNEAKERSNFEHNLN